MNHWFFGNQFGLNFSSGAPVFEPGGQTARWEGCSAISDANGNLLFYTDGIDVWNKLHFVMPNGSGLMGGYGSSTQSSLIVPKPNDSLRFYIFTADEDVGPNGFRYSEVDITLNGGLGDVTLKNIPLITPVSEKVTATRHCNGRDIWVITHAHNSDAFYSYLVTNAGINTTPVISHIGNFVPASYGTHVGQIKVSPDGRKLAAAHGQVGVDLLDFNNQTGVISNPIYIYDNSNSLPYGVEFSPNSSVLYVSVIGYWDADSIKRFTGLFQFNLTLSTSSDIIISKILLYKVNEPREFGCLQLGPDGKIYMPEYIQPFLSVINSPNNVGTACNFVKDGLGIAVQCFFNLPGFAPFSVKDTFSCHSNPGFCINDTIQFSYSIPSNFTSILWDFGDPFSGSSNNSNLPNPYHIYSSGGTYNIKLIKYGICGNDTLNKTIVVGDVTVNLGNDTSYCGQQIITLNPNASGSNTYLWQNGLTAPTFSASTPGVYWVEVKSNNNGCVRRDSIDLTSRPRPVVNLGRDTGLCVNQYLLLDAQNPGADYLWQDNTTNQTIQAKQSGIYWVKVTENDCSFTDTIVISPFSKPTFSLGNDESICLGQTIQLQINLSGVNYLWQDGSVNSSYTVNNEGLYFVDVINQCGITRDSILISKSDCMVFVLNAFTS